MEPLTSVPGWTETDYREGDEATENQTDLLNYKWRQPSGRVARKASLVHNPGCTETTSEVESMLLVTKTAISIA